ncbi:MAG: hypothetical protein DRP45_08955, partial [Candidatus Zixiibacteriota bacterium]
VEVAEQFTIGSLAPGRVSILAAGLVEGDGVMVFSQSIQFGRCSVLWSGIQYQLHQFVLRQQGPGAFFDQFLDDAAAGCFIGVAGWVFHLWPLLTW